MIFHSPHLSGYSATLWQLIDQIDYLLSRPGQQNDACLFVENILSNAAYKSDFINTMTHLPKRG
jgi:hypothetical protein